MSKVFTLEEAQGWIPRLQEWLQTAIQAKDDVVAAEKELQAINTRIHLLGGMELNPSEIAEKRLVKDRGIERLKEAMERIEESGCLVKDLDIGLIDFPAKLGMDEVYLCWKLGEPRIEHWHYTHEGFAGRKPIGSEFGESPSGRAH